MFYGTDDLSFEIFIQLTISGLTTGAVYSLIALGFTTIYRSSNILNLAQGEFVVLGGLLAIFFLKKLGLSYLIAGVSATLVVTFIGMLIQRVVINPIKNRYASVDITITKTSPSIGSPDTLGIGHICSTG